jgi:hypothetical protein
VDFIVKVKGEEETRWVLAVDGDRPLLTHEDRSLRWVSIADCEFAGAAPPDKPRPVVVVKPQQVPSLAIPQPLMRRRGNGS